MGSYLLTEIAVGLIEDHIKANVSAALAAVRTDRGDGLVETPIPQSYFRFPQAHGYRPPAVFIIAEDFDFRLPDGPNHIHGLSKINVSVVVEERNRLLLKTRAWRYQAALAKLLNNTALTNSLDTVKIITKLVRFSFYQIEYNIKKRDTAEAAFREEVVLELEVEHYEQI